MARDFLSNQIKTKQIIGSGEGAISGSQGNPKLMVYSDSDAADSIGGLNPNILDNVGDDVFLFVSGTIGGKENQTNNSITLFGGDVVVSGTLYAERQIVEVDATATGSLQVSGSITHTDGINIGLPSNSEDSPTDQASSYSDGLFTDFTSETLLGDVVDRFNEVLAGLAPSSPPILSTIDARPAFEQPASAYLSFGTSSDQVANGYISVKDTISGGDPISNLHFQPVDINELYEPEDASLNFHKLGIFQKNDDIVGELNYHIASDVYANGTINYSNDAFSNADVGTLKLYLNNSLLHELDLSSYTDQPDPNAKGSSLNANGSGFFNIANKLNTKFSNGNDFDIFNYRTCSWIVSITDQVDGLNFVNVVHQIGDSERITTVAQWVNDSNNESLTASNNILNIVGDENDLKTISGVKYFKTGEVQYSTDINNFYKFVYGKDDVTFEVNENTPNATFVFTNFQVPDIDYNNGEDFTKVLQVSTSSNITLPQSNKMLTDNNSGISVEAVVSHPLKSIDSSATVGYGYGLLFDNVASQSTETHEYFSDEDYRLLSLDYNNPTEINLGTWDSTETLNSGNSNYENGLLVYNGKLMSTSNSSIVNSANFSGLNNGPDNNVDYSSNMLTTDKSYVRKFTNNTGSSIRDFSFVIEGLGTFIEGTTLNENTSDFNLSFKIPGQTGWMDAAKDFVFNENSDSDGGNIGTLDNTIADGPTNYFSFGTEELSDSSDMLVKIISDYTWEGDVDSISIDFSGGVSNTNIVNPTITDNLLSSTTGVAAKLSFGSSFPIDEEAVTYTYTTSQDPADTKTFSAFPGQEEFNTIQYTYHNEFVSSSMTGTFVLSSVNSENYFSLSTPATIDNTTLIATQFDNYVYYVSDPNNLNTKVLKSLGQNAYSNYIYGIQLDVSKTYYFWRESDGYWYYSEASFPYTAGSPGYTSVSGIDVNDAVDVNQTYSIQNVTNSSRLGVFAENITISAVINDDVSGQGTNNNNFIDNSWGRGEAHKGTLTLEINGSVYKTIDLTDLTLSGNQFTDNTGFNITAAVVSKDNNGLPDYRYFYRTGSIFISPDHQRLGWNYARVLHDIGNGTIDQTNYIEWVVSDTFDNPQFEMSSVGGFNNAIWANTYQSITGNVNYLSGVGYYSSATGEFEVEMSNPYKYVYSSSNNAIRFSDTTNISIDSIDLTGDCIVDVSTNNSSIAMPNLDITNPTAHNENLTVTATYSYDYFKSLPGDYVGASIRLTYDFPLGTINTPANFPIPSILMYNVQASNDLSNTVEDFSAESYRLQDNVIANQTDISGLSWDSSVSLTDAVDTAHNTGLQIYDGKLIYPQENFNSNFFFGIKTPNSNIDYDNQTGERTFYRKFQNTTSNSQFGFSLRIKGTNSTISSVDLSDPANSLSADEIKVYAKIPTTSNSQSTGFMDLGNAFNSGQTADHDGCLQGSLNDVIVDTGTGTANTVTFGSSFLSPNDYVIIKIVADESWSGELNRIEVVWS